MRSLVVLAGLTLAVAAAAAPQEPPRQRHVLGADSLFGPGLVDLAPNGNAAKLRLTRPAHVVVFAVRDGETAELVAPRRAETRLSRTGDQWIDLPWAVTSGPTTTFAVAPSGGGGRLPRAGRSGAAAAPDAAPMSSPGTVILVVVADSAWNRDAVNALLPHGPQADAMALANAIATVLLGSRADASAAYLARW